MNSFIWIVQGLSATIFGISGLLKLVTPKDILEEKIGWVKDYSGSTIRFIGSCEFLGGIGLVAPMAFGILPILTPIAATCLAVVMILATRAHLQRKEFKKTPFDLIMCILTIFIAVERF